MEFIKNIEGNIKQFDVNIQLNLRNRTIPIINNSSSKNLTNQKLSNLIKSCNLFVKNNPDIIFTRR